MLKIIQENRSVDNDTCLYPPNKANLQNRLTIKSFPVYISKQNIQILKKTDLISVQFTFPLATGTTALRRTSQQTSHIYKDISQSFTPTNNKSQDTKRKLFSRPLLLVQFPLVCGKFQENVVCWSCKQKQNVVQIHCSM